MKTRGGRLVVALALAGAGMWAAWRVGARLFGADAAGVDRLANQIWIERIPANERDMITHFMALEHPRFKSGGAGHGSRWRLRADFFLWSLKGDELRLDLRQDRKTATFKARTWRCVGEAPKPFELCLEIRRGNHALTLYSKDKWVVRPRAGAGEQDGVAAAIEESAALAFLGQSVEMAGAGGVDDGPPSPEADATYWPFDE